MQKVVVVGAGGRLGKAIARGWAARGLEILALDRKAFPLGDLNQIQAVLDGYEFDTLINCAALTNVDYCEKNREEAFLINAEAPRVLAEVCTRKAARCVHISTDYVFDGLKRSPYVEEDVPHAVSVYGESKLAGEQSVLGADSSHWVVRVSWVFGPDRPSFVDQIIQRALKETAVSAVCDKWATPTYTLDAEEALFTSLQKQSDGGVFHLSNSGDCSWQEYGQWALDCAREAGVELAAARVDAIRMADLAAFIAVRPPYTVLGCDKLARLCGGRLRDWKEAVRHHVQMWAASRNAEGNG
jgi:dTDP-4-dehydrorhamnose reductase